MGSAPARRRAESHSLRDPQMNSSEIQILRLCEVIKHVCLSKPSIYRSLNEGVFPKPICLGERTVGWPATEIDE